MDTNASFFHPQLLFLRLPEDNYNVDFYDITINGSWQRVFSKQYYWPKHLEPGTNYTVWIVAHCWWSESYRKRSTYNGYIQTQRKHKTFCIMLCPIFINKRLKKIKCKLKQYHFHDDSFGMAFMIIPHVGNLYYRGLSFQI